MVTFGFASVVRGVLNMTWGSDTRPFPALFSSQPFHLGPVPVSPVHLCVFVTVLVLLAAFSLFFKFSLVGMAMRATADNQQVAQSLGISVKWIFALSWCIATVVSALGGIILGSVRGGVDFSLADYGLKVFPVVILGGLDSVPGAIVAVLLVVPTTNSVYWLDVLNRIGIAIIGALGLNILIGFAGQISIGHAAFLAVGAYATAILETSAGLPFFLAIPLAALFTSLFGLLFGIPSLRLKGLYLAIATLAAHFITTYRIVHWEGVTKGVIGLAVPP